MTKINEEIMCNIINDYKNGMSPIKLSRKYNEFSSYTIRENLKLYVVYNNNRFTEIEINSIINDYNNGLKLCDLAEKYSRPEETIRRKLQSMGIYNIKKYDTFTQEEVEIIRKYYPAGNWDMLLKLIPNHSKQSLAVKASKLGLKQNDWNWKGTDIQKILEQYGLYLTSPFTNIQNYHELSDCDGYLYKVSLSTIIYQNSVPSKFHMSNPYTIHNIRNYLAINNIDCKLISDRYTNNTDKMLWECSCGKYFKCSWQDFYNGKHQCNDCGAKIRSDHRSYTIDEIKSFLHNTRYTIVEDSFSRLTNGFTCIDSDGYKVVMSRQSVFHKQSPEIFHPKNPYTIENIQHHLVINGINCELISNTYTSNTVPLLWRCSCGNIFKKDWNSFKAGLTLCPKCAKEKIINLRKIPHDEIVGNLKSKGLSLLYQEYDLTACDPIDVIDTDGYKYRIRYTNIIKGKIPEKFYISNPYTIENINLYFSLFRNGDYKCLADLYTGNDKIMKFIHIPCNTVFEATWVQMQGKLSDNGQDRYYKQCPKCNTNKIESIHASVLKQVFLHEYPDTIVEDKSCINPNTNYVLPTDIVNHRLKIAIEIQSSYHDYEDKKTLDKIKKSFWINQGYSFYDPDIRDYSILQMIQLFFKDIKEVPNYIDYHFGDCIDFRKIQELLNDGKSISEISSITGVKHGTINALCLQNKIVLPKDYKKNILNHRPIVRLSKDNVFIKRYKNLSSVKNDGLSPNTIRNVLVGKRKFSYGSFWVYEDDYENGQYVIPEEDFDHFSLPVDKFDMNDNYICSYNTIYDAEKDSVSNRHEIYRVAKGEVKSSRKEKWKFKDVA